MNHNTIRAPLFVPGDRPERFGKAAASGADAIIIDFEDAVGAPNKGAAREAVLRPGALPDMRILVRVNAIGTAWHAADIAAVAQLPRVAVVLPKAESPGDIAALGENLGGTAIIALVESARGVANAREIAGLSVVAGMAFGSIDFCADLGCAHTREALLMARAELVLASRLGGLAPALDGVTTSITDPGLAEDDARYAAGLGFGGKLCIHPSQVAAVLRGFAPSEAEIAWAAKILAGGEDGAANVDGTMVDAPVRARARRILDDAGK